MNEKTGLASFGLDDAIRLRWVLRDIKGNRLKLTPASPDDIRLLVEMGFVEMENDKPAVTSSGLSEMDRGD